MHSAKYFFLIICLAIADQILVAQSPLNSPNMTQDIKVQVSGITTLNQLYALTGNQRLIVNDYKDGLGRSIQKVAVQASPNQKDVVNFSSYNNLGQMLFSYKSYASTDIDGKYHSAAATDQASYYSNGTSDKVTDDSKPWSQKVVEKSPLERILYSGMDGDKFQPNTADPSQHYKTFINRSNNSSVYTNDSYNSGIRLWTSDGTSAGLYPTGSLSVLERTDESGNASCIYKNSQEKIVLKRQLISSQTIDGSIENCLDTYYIYDDAGELLYIIPPKSLALIRNANPSPWSVTVSGVQSIIFQFIYDNLGRITQKKVPGAGWIYIVYDPLNRPVLIQDANLRPNNKWLYFKYDIKKRVVSSGIYTDAVNGTTISAMQSYVNGLSSNYNTYYYEERQTGGTSPNFYTNRVFPTANQDVSAFKPMSYSYFDDYDLDGNGSADYSYISQALSNEASSASKNKGKETVQFEFTINNDASLNVWLRNVMFYDVRDNVIQVISNNQTNASAADTKTIVPDFVGKKMQMKVVRTVSTVATTVLTTYAYDNFNRISTVDLSNNGASNVRVAAYFYNEIGQQVAKKLHSTDLTNFLQNVDYRYDINGRITSINNSNLSSDGGVTNNDSNDLFGMDLLYNNTDATLANVALFNGMISAVKWKAASPVPGNSNLRSYKYSYDQLNRLVGAHYAEWNASASNWTSSSGYNDENVGQYDLNGNIEHLTRYAGNTLIDDLQYSYTGNTLTNISDNSSNTAGFNGAVTSAYVFDNGSSSGSGNLTSDPKKGVTISYNILNRTDKITFTASGNYIRYSYDGSGQLIRKETYTNSSGTTVLYDYIDGFVYQNNSISYYPMEEGRVRNNAGAFTLEYFIRDHLGNVRVSFDGVGTVAQVKQEDSYYPFGMILPGNYAPTQPNNNLFNGGNEWQNDFGNLPDLYQTLFRNYDPQTGRFISVDPKAISAESLTPFQFGGNNPMSLNDIFGDQLPEGGNDIVINNMAELLALLAEYGTEGFPDGALTIIAGQGGSIAAVQYDPNPRAANHNGEWGFWFSNKYSSDDAYSIGFDYQSMNTVNVNTKFINVGNFLNAMAQYKNKADFWDYAGVGLSMVGNVLEIFTGVLLSETGLGAFAAVDGTLRLMANFNKLGQYALNGKKEGDAAPGNGGALVGMAADEAIFDDEGAGTDHAGRFQTILGTTNDLVSILAPTEVITNMGTTIQEASMLNRAMNHPTLGAGSWDTWIQDGGTIYTQFLKKKK